MFNIVLYLTAIYRDSTVLPTKCYWYIDRPVKNVCASDICGNIFGNNQNNSVFNFILEASLLQIRKQGLLQLWYITSCKWKHCNKSRAFKIRPNACRVNLLIETKWYPKQAWKTPTPINVLRNLECRVIIFHGLQGSYSSGPDSSRWMAKSWLDCTKPMGLQPYFLS